MTAKRKRIKQQENLLEVLIITTVIAMGVLLILVVSHVCVNVNISKNQKAVETLSKEVSSLQEEIDTTQTKYDEYKKQMDQLQAQLAKYQDVVIPDSMQ